MRTPVRKVLADNLKTLMRRTVGLKTQAQVAERSGVAQTTVSNMLRPDTASMTAPKLDNVEKVASAFGLATWQLLIDVGAVGAGIADLLMRPAEYESRRLVHLDEHRKVASR
jgi:transcriptional regulator with XRE-family HTH domain